MRFILGAKQEVQVVDTSTPILQQLTSKEEQFQLLFLV
jgi:hypothetical protein